MTTDMLLKILQMKREVDSFLPKSKAAKEFKLELSENKALEWVWSTEALRPDFIPQGLPIFYRSRDLSDKWDLTVWRQIREGLWAESFGSGVVSVTELNIHSRGQRSYDPCVPGDTESKDVFRLLLALAPDAVFKWLDFLKSILSFPQAQDFIDIDRDFTVHFSNDALEFLLVESRARKWRKRIGSIEIAEIADIPWVFEAEHRRLNPIAHAQIEAAKIHRRIAEKKRGVGITPIEDVLEKLIESNGDYEGFEDDLKLTK